MKCPGQDTQYWKPGSIFETQCPECGQEVEFFKDDASRKCQCGHRFINPELDFGCASYCQYAEQCLGSLPPEALAQQKDALKNVLKDRVAIEMKRYFKTDFKRIGHATRVARYAERIGKKERGNLSVILSAAYLHDIGIHEAEKNQTEKNQADPDPSSHEKEGVPIARQILELLGAPAEMIDDVCDIVGHHHHPGPEETLDFKVVYDADMIVNLMEKNDKTPIDPNRAQEIIQKKMLTDAGRREASGIFEAN